MPIGLIVPGGCNGQSIAAATIRSYGVFDYDMQYLNIKCVGGKMFHPFLESIPLLASVLKISRFAPKYGGTSLPSMLAFVECIGVLVLGRNISLIYNLIIQAKRHHRHDQTTPP